MSISTPEYCLGHTYMSNVSVVYLKFKCDWVSCIFFTWIWPARRTALEAHEGHLSAVGFLILLPWDRGMEDQAKGCQVLVSEPCFLA